MWKRWLIREKIMNHAGRGGFRISTHSRLLVQVVGGFECKFHHCAERQLALLGRELLSRDERVADGQQAGGILVQVVGIVEKGKALHFHAFSTAALGDLLKSFTVGIGIEHVGRMYPACLYVDAQSGTLGQDGIVQSFAGIVYLFLITTVGQRIRRFAVGAVGQNDIEDVEA